MENAWLHVALEVLKGSYNESNDSTAESIIIGLRSQTHPDCVKALEAICKLHKKKNPNTQPF